MIACFIDMVENMCIYTLMKQEPEIASQSRVNTTHVHFSCSYISQEPQMFCGLEFLIILCDIIAIFFFFSFVFFDSQVYCEGSTRNLATKRCYFFTSNSSSNFHHSKRNFRNRVHFFSQKKIVA
jgi:hypothetical protein